MVWGTSKNGLSNSKKKIKENPPLVFKIVFMVYP